MALATDPIIVAMRGVHVGLPGWTPVRDIHWDLRRGEIHAIVGEHRSGKSTMAGLMTGVVTKQAGEFSLFGKSADSFTPKRARAAGIASLGQESRLLPGMSVAENILLGCKSFSFITGRWMHSEAAKPLIRLGADIPLTAKIRDISQDKQCMVEIAKTIVDDPGILILDEISQRFTPNEMEKVHTLLRDWRDEGRSAVFICSTLDEALECSDRVTFMNSGSIKGTEDVASLDRFRIINLAMPSLASREKLRQANIELYNYKRYNESLIRNLPLGVVIIDPDRRVHLINQEAAAIMGADIPLFSGKRIEDVFVPGLCAMIDAVALSTISAEEELDIGETPARVTVFPFQDEDGGVLGSVALIEDISVDQRMKEYLVRAERLRSAAELAAGVAHEINNPLCVIRNYVELLKRQPSSPEAPKRLDKIGVELDWIVEIVSGMLSFARPGDTSREKLDCVTVINDAMTLLRYRFRDKGVDVSCDFPDGGIPILGSASRLKQLFVNLLTNAVDAVEAGGKIRLDARVCDNNSYTEIVVADNGAGVPEEALEQIFNPFFTTKTGRTNTGLGLSICQQIVDTHHGLIFAGRKDGWTAFTIRLPACGDNCP